jgi:hypothetical protein
VIETDVPGSPGWWLKHLSEKLGAKVERINLLEKYLDGRACLPIQEGMSPRFRQFLKRSNLNFGALIVDAVADRLEPMGFRTGASGDEITDREAWRVWQANNMDATAKPFYRSILGLSEGYRMIGGVDVEIGAPLITAEDPRQVITEQDPARPWRTLAGLKIWHDPAAGGDWAVVHPRAGEVWYAFRRRATTEGSYLLGPAGFECVSAQRVPLTRIPIVRYTNRTNLLGRPMGEFEDVLDHLDRINHMILQRLVIATLQAFKQRAVKGLPLRDENGNEIDYTGLFESGPDALWQLPGVAEMWESGQVDLTGILTGTRDDVRDLAAVTRTPLYMLTADAAAGSAEGASLQKEGLAFKCRDRLTELSDPEERTLSIAFEVMGDAVRARTVDMEMLWMPVTAESMAERYDAAAKAEAAGVPWRGRMEDVLKATPQQIERWKKEREEEKANEPTPPPLQAPAPQDLDRTV